MNSKIKNIVFDLGGVLINLDFNRCINAFREAGFTDIEQLASPFKDGDLFSQFELGTITTEEFREAIRKVSGTALTDSRIDGMWNSMLIGIPAEKLDLLLELRQRYRIFLLSNTNSLHWNYACEQLFQYHSWNVTDFFEQYFLSFEMHQAKPAQSIFRQMMKEADISPEETLFIDDSLANCKSAIAVGIESYHYQIGEDLSPLFKA